MKSLTVVLLATAILVGCSGPLWNPPARGSDDGTLTITIEGLPSVIEYPWILQPGQSAHYTAGIWYLYQDGLVIDLHKGY